MASAITDRFKVLFAFIAGLAGSLESWLTTNYQQGLVALGLAGDLPSTPRSLMADSRGQVDTVISAVVIIAVAFVGLVIVGMLYNAMPDTGNAEVDNASDNLLTGFVDAMGFVEIIVLVLFAVVVIGAVQQMRSR